MVWRIKHTNVWWLRDKGAYDLAGLMALEDGKCESMGGTQNIEGIRPAMRILKNHIDFATPEDPVLEGQLSLLEVEKE